MVEWWYYVYTYACFSSDVDLSADQPDAPIDGDTDDLSSNKKS